MPNKGVRAWVDESVCREFARVAETSHMTPPGAAKMVISRLSQLRDGMLLDAISSIPREYFRADFPPRSRINSGR